MAVNIFPVHAVLEEIPLLCESNVSDGGQTSHALFCTLKVNNIQCQSIKFPIYVSWTVEKGQ